MDLKVIIVDENDEVLESFRIYQDGSDVEGAAKIASLCEMHFEVEDD